jgi:hypothetical protein
MYSRTAKSAFIVLAWVVPATLQAQFNFTVDGRQVQIHSFASQGFLASNDNNYLTTKSSQGSFAFTDFGFNVSAPITDRFRLGAQLYDRNVGNLGNWEPTLDWAVADYKFKDWFGVRGGKVKTMLGLYNDTQDMEFLHTWALLPQSTYPVDLRGDTIAHLGADLYGNISIKKFGSLSYTLWGGKRPDDPNGGYVYSLVTTQGGITTKLPTNRAIDSYGGPAYGSDLRWTTPVKGLMVGVSLLKEDITTKGYFKVNHNPYVRYTVKDSMPAFYAQYTYGNFRFDGEYRNEDKVTEGLSITGVLNNNPPQQNDIRMGYVSAAYRISKRVEIGTYHSRYYPTWHSIHSLPADHLFDQAVTARFDLNNYFDFKVEGHFMDGDPTGNATRGFYPQENPTGLRPKTDLLVLRVGFHI